jgi:hypothetical protein
MYLLHYLLTIALHVLCSCVYICYDISQAAGVSAAFAKFASADAVPMTKGVACVKLCAATGAFNIDTIQFA